MSDHFIIKCRVCDTTITQCRCMDPHKKVILELCVKCQDRVKEAAERYNIPPQSLKIPEVF